MYITLKLPEIHYQINLVSYKTLHSKLPPIIYGDECKSRTGQKITVCLKNVSTKQADQNLKKT
ncbi:unnamed protein product [Brassica oleracea var. botrytis]|uniref:Uncharacterized protein n=1 Tax=Brassica oleracea TaxID=3712 RepID=A0A3P6F0J2_BRAOL|nr:unnamed protein product [Brassica oleracea]